MKVYVNNVVCGAKFAGYLKKYRKVNKIDQPEMAKFLGVTRRQYQGYEQGTNDIYKPSFVKVANKLQLTPKIFDKDGKQIF